MWNIIPPSNRYKKMTAINNATNNIVRMVAKNTTIPSLVAEQMSTKFIATIASVRNTPSSLNRHGNTFQGVIASSTATQPGAIKNIHSTAAQQITAAKTPLYNPLNRHGNTFQGVIASSTGTQPGTIKNIHSTAAQQITAAKTPLYNPLNRHGNTFQGVIASSTATQPGAIKNIHSTAAQQITAAKTPLYNPLNRHGNTFQGAIASSTGTQPGTIKNIHSTAAQQITAAKTPLYNPLNRHGNTFQGVIASSTATQPGAIKNIHSTAAQQITAAKTPLYNPLNRHGNTFQGVIASSTATQPGAIKNIHSTAGSAIDKTSAPPTNDVTLIKVVDYMSDRVNEDSYNQTHEYATLSDELNTSTECELDEYLFDSYPLFGDTPKDSPNESSPYTEELKIPNKPFNPLNYTLTYMQPDEVVYTEAPRQNRINVTQLSAKISAESPITSGLLQRRTVIRPLPLRSFQLQRFLMLR